MNVLILGNITRDVYLSLDPTKNNLEQGKGTYWLDLPFDGSSTSYFNHTSILGGSAITFEVLSKFTIPAEISNTTATFKNSSVTIPIDTPTTYRFILSADSGAHYFYPMVIPATVLSPPDSIPSYIFIDRSATITRDLSDKLLSYLSLATNTRLIIFISHHTDTAKPYIQALIDKASLVFSDTNYPTADYQITPTSIITHTHSISWSHSHKHDIITDLTAHSIIAATLLAAILQDLAPEDQLLLAKYNVENSTLNGTVNVATLKEQIMDQQWQVKSIANLRAIAKQLLTRGKGILAADESGGSIAKKFASMNITDDEQHRRDYRNIFFTTPDLEQYASGAILFDETSHQHADNGTDYPTFLAKRSVIPGIKVDQGLAEQPNNETLTKGLDGLPNRLANYYNMGLRFAKWRAAFQATDTTPTDENIKQNCDILAQYAKDCQVTGLVPIVEPELIYDGNYPIEKSAEATTRILKQLIQSLREFKVDLSATIIKTNMVLAGKQQEHQSTPEEVGYATAEVLRATIPDDIAGVVFLSGGQSVEQSTTNLQAVTNEGPFPWPVTFSFARALQDPALQAWQGDNANSDLARQAFRLHLIANSNALIKQ